SSIVTSRYAMRLRARRRCRAGAEGPAGHAKGGKLVRNSPRKGGKLVRNSGREGGKLVRNSPRCGGKIVGANSVHLAANVRGFRDQSGITQADLAARIGVMPRFVRAIEAGRGGRRVRSLRTTTPR